MSDKRLTRLQKKFVKSYAPLDKHPADAVIEAGYSPGTRSAAHTEAHRLLAKPHVQNALQEAIAKTHPDIPHKISQTLVDLLSDPKPEVRIRAIDLYVKVFGWAAAQKKVTTKLSFNLPKE